MALPRLNDTHPNELFRFMYVRSPLPQRATDPRVHFIDVVYERLTDQTLSMLADGRDLLYPHLKALDGVSDQLTLSVRRAALYRNSNQYIPSPDHYALRYPQLSGFVEWLDANADHATAAELSEAALPVIQPRAVPPVPSRQEFIPPLNELLILQAVLWDNLFANLLAATDAQLVTLACKYLGALNVLDLLQNKPGFRNSEAIDQDPVDADPVDVPAGAYRARPLLPKWFVKLSVSIERNPDEGVAQQPPPIESGTAELRARFQRVTQASADLKALTAKRKSLAASAQTTADRGVPQQTAVGPDAKKPTNPKSVEVPNVMRVSAADLKAVSGPVAAVAAELLGDAGTFEVDHLSNLLDSQAVFVGGILGEKAQRRAIKVGNAIITADEFCADMLERDPCARLPRKQFESRGSYVSGMMVGDLLVTKQQLVKYDLGEVAHVENAMAGLEKERIHRRLYRSEESTLIETETTTEDERETQSTDRFEMEKETSKALTETSNLKTGLTMSGEYGPVKFDATMEASFGQTSQQSQSDASKFSHEVTTRALKRVKERVRQMKTVTVVNEVEETTRHTLKNPTTDSVNGVYRWLDKFYLNKIVNYGKRLMFEFAVPEPAQFYVFRQLVKPKAGNTMVIPDDPASVTDPSGHPLTSPASINETNYTFWAALYGATDIEPPPEQYIRVSHAWKNEFAPPQDKDFFSSFSTNVELPKEYEAISATIWGHGHFLGSVPASGNVAGTIGAAYFFGNGTIMTLALPNISGTLGIGLLTVTINWKLNVVILLERSAKSKAQWQIGTYAKILNAYRRQKQEYDGWLEAQSLQAGIPSIGGQNPAVNREIEREELKRWCLELFTGQRFESFDAAVNGIYNQSAYPEILFAEAIREGNLVKFFEQAFDWPNMTYIFYDTMWGRKSNWLTAKLIEDPSDPLFTKFLQAGFARVAVPARRGFENLLMMFHLLSGLISSLGCAWNFQPSIFGALGISNTFSPGVSDPVYMSISQELQDAAGYSEETGPIYGTPYVQKVPTNLVYIAQNSHTPNTPWPGLPDHSTDPDIARWL